MIEQKWFQIFSCGNQVFSVLLNKTEPDLSYSIVIISLFVGFLSCFCAFEPSLFLFLFKPNQFEVGNERSEFFLILEQTRISSLRQNMLVPAIWRCCPSCNSSILKFPIGNRTLLICKIAQAYAKTKGVVLSENVFAYRRKELAQRLPKLTKLQLLES